MAASLGDAEAPCANRVAVVSPGQSARTVHINGMEKTSDRY
jgi:hypothetical protein